MERLEMKEIKIKIQTFYVAIALMLLAIIGLCITGNIVFATAMVSVFCILCLTCQLLIEMLYQFPGVYYLFVMILWDAGWGAFLLLSWYIFKM